MIAERIPVKYTGKWTASANARNEFGQGNPFALPGLLDFAAVLRQEEGGQTPELAVRLEPGTGQTDGAAPEDGASLARLQKRTLTITRQGGGT